MSVLALAPWAQPGVQWPRLMHAARPSYSVVAMVVSDGHQCQPSLFRPVASLAPPLPSGSGGIARAGRGGLAGSPAMPETPIIASFRSNQGSRSR